MKTINYSLLPYPVYFRECMVEQVGNGTRIRLTKQKPTNVESVKCWVHTSTDGNVAFAYEEDPNDIYRVFCNAYIQIDD